MSISRRGGPQRPSYVISMMNSREKDAEYERLHSFVKSYDAMFREVDVGHEELDPMRFGMVEILTPASLREWTERYWSLIQRLIGITSMSGTPIQVYAYARVAVNIAYKRIASLYSND